MSIEMSISTHEEYEYTSVDLTEDENSCEENYGRFQFVDCSNPEISDLRSPSPPPLTPITQLMTSQAPKQTLRLRPIPQLLENPGGSETTLNQSGIGKSVGRCKPIQIKPTVSTEGSQGASEVNERKKIETVYVDSGDEEAVRNKVQAVVTNPQQTVNVAQAQTGYSINPPGKLVMIRKNNKLYKIVIPHNVMPNINQSIGPVLINIPEVGPLVISNDPRVSGANPIRPQNNVQQLSLNLDELEGKPTPTPPKKKQKLASVKEAALCDKRFCWNYSMRRKRDLDGFTFNDRLGFTKTEVKKAKKCEKVLYSIIHRKETLLLALRKKLKIKTVNKCERKIVKIHDIVDRLNKEQAAKAKALANSTSCPSASSFPTYMQQTDDRSGNSQGGSEQHSEYDSDLLLTKKVVILNAKNNEIDLERVLKGRGRPRKLKKQTVEQRVTAPAQTPPQRKIGESTLRYKRPLVKPCYVKMMREEHVEEEYKKYCKNVGLYKKKKPTPAPVQIKVGKKTLGTNNVDCTVTKQVTSDLAEKHLKVLSKNIISTETKFKAEITYYKPILIIKEPLPQLVYSNEFSRSNIIYIVNEKRTFPKTIVQNTKFISAIELGYVKLVESQLFCNYVLNKIQLKAPKTEAIGEHNYCLGKDK